MTPVYAGIPGCTGKSGRCCEPSAPALGWSKRMKRRVLGMVRS